MSSLELSGRSNPTDRGKVYVNLLVDSRWQFFASGHQILVQASVHALTIQLYSLRAVVDWTDEQTMSATSRNSHSFARIGGPTGLEV